MKNLVIPAGLDFSDLQLEITPDGELRYLPAPLGEFALRNGLDPELVGDEDRACELVCCWYVSHREANGAPDNAAEAVIAGLLRMDPSGLEE